MKIRQLFTIILVIMIVIMGTGCSGERNVDPAASFSDLYDLTKNSNQTYSYTFSDLYGNKRVECQSFSCVSLKERKG